MKSIDPKELSTKELFGILTSSVTPRPIAFASTISKKGEVNLSPFSFFNVFSAAPPILIFSSSRRVRDNTTKHTLENVIEVPEVVINIVNYDMVQQTSLSSTEYAKGVNEFIKSGFTETPSTIITPPRVAESPVSFECKVTETIALGDQGGAGNLIVCEVLMIHINEDILDNNGQIDPLRLKAVGRLGQNYYSVINEASLFEVAKPLSSIGIGIDQLPANIKNSNVLTGNDLGMLGNITALPSKNEIVQFVNNYKKEKGENYPVSLEEKHLFAKAYIEKNDIHSALKVLLS